MITLTRLNGHKLVVNAELIKTVEQSPDTMLTLINGDHLVVCETVEEVVARAVDYGRRLRVFADVSGGMEQGQLVDGEGRCNP